jgi:hypothetical protein
MAQFEVISTTRRVIVQLRDGTRILEAPQDATVLRYPTVQVSRALRAPGAPTFLWYQALAGRESLIFEFNSAGAVVNSWTLPATVYAPRSRRVRDTISSAIIPLISRVPFDISGRMKLIQPSMSRTERTTGFWAPAILASLISALAVFIHGRRYAFAPGRLYTWTGIALLLGPLGYLLMLALIEWPARESCPACTKKRVVTRERCEHCGEPFAAPPQDGTEIIEPGLVT